MSKSRKTHKHKKDKSIKQKSSRKEKRQYSEETLDFHTIHGVSTSAEDFLDEESETKA